MKLYVMPGACSQASHIALLWAGAPFELVVLSHAEAGGDAYATINPKRAVPALALKDGAVITESLAVLEYIADAHPEARLGAAPGDVLERARLNEALADLVSNVHAAWAPIFVPSRFIGAEAQFDAVRQAAFAQLDKHYHRLDALMKARAWMVADRRTVADAYLYVMCTWKGKTATPLTRYPALQAFKTRLETDACVQRAVTAEQAPAPADQKRA